MTVLRPVKGLEPHLYECLAATFHQTYPKEKLTIRFCIDSRNDPAYSILQRLLTEFTTFDVEILVEEEDPNLSGRNGEIHNLGPNPKIRNMSRGYREAKGDIIWIIDCNVWISQGVAGRMVDLLCGFTQSNPGLKYKFVHQLPLVVDITSNSSISSSQLLPSSPSAPSIGRQPQSSKSPFLSSYGGLLEEIFLSTAHAKFYTAISAVAIAPCIVGKSNMFRRSHLNALTVDTPSRSPGIDSFSDNICEDHLIGDLLWRSPVPQSVRSTAALEGVSLAPSERRLKNSPKQPFDEQQAIKWRNHGLLRSDLAIQPTSRLPLSDYLARRVRWLRVRKFTVTLATFVEPGTESLLCTFYLALGVTTSPSFQRALAIPPSSWSAFFLIWAFGVLGWMTVDYAIWHRLQSGATIEGDGPTFLKGRRRRPFREWVLGWAGREALALGVWVWAVIGGVKVVWRGRRFWVGVDMKVHEIKDEGTANGSASGKTTRKGKE